MVMGDVQRLPNGNTDRLLLHASGVIDEVNAQGSCCSG